MASSGHIQSATAFLTVATAEYLPQVMVLKGSLEAAYGSCVSLSVLLIGDEAALAAAARQGLDVVSVDELAIPTFWDMAFRYEKGALANALKSFFIRHAVTTREPETVVFLDADIAVYSPLDEVQRLLDSGQASIVLTPHLERPQRRTREPSELDLLRHGIVNGGFVALRPDRNARAFLGWWSDHMLTECRYEPEKGLYGDQHWLDLVPSLFGGVHILRHRGYNAAYWNFPDRRPRRAGETWSIDADPLRFFHFSQWRIGQGETVAACMDRLFRSDDDELSLLLSRYHRAWSAAAAALTDVPAGGYPFGRFDDGTPIPSMVRDAYAALSPRGPADREALFARGLERVLAPAQELPAHWGVPLPHLYAHIWRRRPDLHNGRIDLQERDGQVAFFTWLLSHGMQDHALPPAALEPARRGLRQRQLPESLIEKAREELSRARKLHGSSVITDETLAEMLSAAGEVLDTLARFLGSACPERAASTDSFFAGVSTLRREVPEWPGIAVLERGFGEIEAHRAYLAAKRPEVDAGRPDSPDAVRRLESDALVNACACLAAMVETAESQRRCTPMPHFAPGSRPLAVLERP